MPAVQSYWDDDISILSSENVNFAIETAGLGSRFAANIADITLQMLVTIFVGIIGTYFAEAIGQLLAAGKVMQYFVYALLTIIVFSVG